MKADLQNLTSGRSIQSILARGGNEQQVSEALRQAGIPGIKYLDQQSRGTFDLLDLQRSRAYWEKNPGPEATQRIQEIDRAIEEEKTKPRTSNYVVFDDKLIDITHKDGTPVTAAERREITDELFQGAGVKRGSIRLAEQDARATITLFKHANASTFIHETGHEWLNRMMQDARDSQAPEDLKRDASTVLDWLGVDSADAIKTKHHEKFARGFETYMMEGRAPSQALASVFEKFARWLTRIYQTVARLKAPINDDIRDMFDRLLTTKPEPRQAVVAPERPPTKGFADLHEEIAEAAVPENAVPVAENIRAERHSHAAENLLPEEQNARLGSAGAASRSWFSRLRSGYAYWAYYYCYYASCYSYCGCISACEDDCSGSFVTPLMRWLDAYHVSYLGWTWDTWDCRRGPALISKYDGTATPYGAAVKAHFRTR